MPKKKEEKHKSVEKDLKEKEAKQRAERGFSDSDVRCIMDRFLEIVPQMLRQLKRTHIGHPALTVDGSPMTDKQWSKILERMLFLLKEMDENSCSLKNPYDGEWWLMHQEFDEKYPDKDVLKTEAELEEEKKTKCYLGVGPERDPDRGKHFVEIRNQKLEWDRFISEYRNKCKNEFFKLFSDYFWDLWD